MSSIVIITGLPCTGKTTLGQFLSPRLGLPFLSKDAIKESLFDSIGWSDRAWAKKLGVAAYRIFDYFIEQTLRVDGSIILESNFKPQFDTSKFQRWQADYGFRAVQIECFANGDVLFERFKARALSGARHPGHDDANNLDEFKTVLAPGKSGFLNIDGRRIEVDTTDFSAVDYEAISRAVHREL